MALMTDTNINLAFIIMVIMAHTTGDYLFQSDYLAANKGKDFYVLFVHCVLYTFGVFLVFTLFGINLNSIQLCAILIAHIPLDYLKASGKSVEWLGGSTTALLYDQLIHYLVLLAVVFYL